jgi:hypothetical protein
MRLGILRLEVDGSAAACRSVIGLPEIKHGMTQIIVRLCEIRTQKQSASIACNCLIELPKSSESVTQVIVDPGVIGQQSGGHSKCWQSVLALPRQGQAQRLPNNGGVGMQAEKLVSPAFQIHVARCID